jgi:hypothetical protein
MVPSPKGDEVTMTLRAYLSLIRTPAGYALQLRLLKVYFCTQLWSARQATGLMKISLRLLDAEIRLCREALLQIGEEEEVDLVVEYVARQLTRRPQLPELDAAPQ